MSTLATQPPKRPILAGTARVALAGIVCYLAVAGAVLVATGTPAWFVHFGSQTIPVAAARRLLGPHVATPNHDGHDGRFFWVLARDPLLLHPHDAAANLDRPAYRAQRVAYPALVSAGRLFGEWGVVWALLAVNVLVVALGSLVTAALVVDIGAPARAVWAWAANPAVATAVFLDTADALAIFAVLAAVLAMRRKRFWLAVAAATLAVLAKEPMWLGIAALAAVTPGLASRDRFTLAGLPAFVGGLWGLYLRWRLGWPATHLQELSAPLWGYVDAYRRGWHPIGDWGDAVVAVAVLGLAVVLVWQWWHHPSVLLTVALPFALLVPFLSAQVLDLADNSLRALGPALTLGAIDLYARTARPMPDPPRPGALRAALRW